MTKLLTQEEIEGIDCMEITRKFKESVLVPKYIRNKKEQS